jgi:hypothetical protein
MASTRIERDSFGPIEVPDECLWGAQTQRSLQHFKISTERMAPELIAALAAIKHACAQVNCDLGLVDAQQAGAIMRAADEVSAGMHADEFPLAVWQTGSGTQTNMNMNEVLANRASELSGGARGEQRLVHPNDTVNRGQSSNDIFPTAMHVAAALPISSRSAAPICRTRRRSPWARNSPAMWRSWSWPRHASARRCRRCARWPWVALRSAPASTRIRSSARAWRSSWRPASGCRLSAHPTSLPRWRRTMRWWPRTAR